MSKRPGRRWAGVAGSALAAFSFAAFVFSALFLAPPALGEPPAFLQRKGPYHKGQIVTIHGRLSAADGSPLGQVSVLLEASRHAFQLRKMGKVTGNTLRMPTLADENGRFRIDWRWDPYYNLFALVVAMPVREAGRERYEEFTRLDITAALSGASPIEVGLTVPDSAALKELQAFLRSVRGEDQKRIYREMGRPDRVDEGQAHYDPEFSWWYFAAGKVYRFRAGELDRVDAFEPIPIETE